MFIRKLLSADDRDNNRPYHSVTTHIPPQSAAPYVSSSPTAVTDSLKTHTLLYILVPLIALVVVALVSLLIHVLVRRQRQLAGHQQLVYRFDAHNDDAAWESDLLEEADPPFITGSQSPIVRGSLSLQRGNAADSVNT